MCLVLQECKITRTIHYLQLSHFTRELVIGLVNLNGYEFLRFFIFQAEINFPGLKSGRKVSPYWSNKSYLVVKHYYCEYLEYKLVWY